MNATPRTFSAQGAGAPIELNWSLHSPRDLWRTWGAFSDTDRFNRAGRLGHRLQEMMATDGTVTRVGEMREFGYRIRWLEHAFDYERPTGFRAEREFLNGPARGYTLDVRLRPDGDGTHVDYRVVGFARWWWLRPFTWLIFTLRVRPSVGRALRLLLHSLERSETLRVSPEDTLNGEAQNRLQQACSSQKDPAMAEHLRALLSDGADFDQERLDPLNLAARWGMPIEKVVDGCLIAVHSGVLSLHWDLLCPSCRGPKVRLERLDLTGVEPHCTSCNIRYDADLANNVVISFQTTLRQCDSAPACVGNPRATPHLLARRDLKPQEVHEFKLRLDPGRYRVRRQDSLFGAELLVEDQGPSQVGFSLEPEGFGPEVVRAGAGTVSVWIRNVSGATVRVALEEENQMPWGITLAQILSRDEAKALLPEGAIPADLDLNIQRQAVIQLERLHPQESLVEAALQRLEDVEPAWKEQGARVIRLGWPTVAGALRGLERLIGCTECCCSLSIGLVLRVGSENGDHHGGLAVEQGRLALTVSVPGGSSLTQEGAEDSEFQAHLALHHSIDRVAPGPLIRGRRDLLMHFVQKSTWRSQRTSDPRLPDEMIGLVFRNRYRLTEILGQGGYGTVFGAVDEVQDQDVVLKLLHPKLTEDPQVVLSFFDEARSCMSMESPHIVRMMDFGHTQDGMLFCIMEQLVGRTLEEIPAPLRTVELISQVCLDVARGLIEVHGKNMVHRDLKPSNIFVVRGESGRARGRLIDFGIALHLLEPNPLERTGEVVGSAPYISPEQVTGTRSSASADIYALGMVMYRCFVGHHPFHNLDAIPQLMRRAAVAVPSVGNDSQYPLPDELVRLVDDCLERDPTARPASAQEFVDRLKEGRR